MSASCSSCIGCKAKCNRSRLAGATRGTGGGTPGRFLRRLAVQALYDLGDVLALMLRDPQFAGIGLARSVAAGDC